jgi:hypothetical protein
MIDTYKGPGMALVYGPNSMREEMISVAEAVVLDKCWI